MCERIDYLRISHNASWLEANKRVLNSGCDCAFKGTRILASNQGTLCDMRKWSFDKSDIAISSSQSFQIFQYIRGALFDIRGGGGWAWKAFWRKKSPTGEVRLKKKTSLTWGVKIKLCCRRQRRNKIQPDPDIRFEMVVFKMKNFTHQWD